MGKHRIKVDGTNSQCRILGGMKSLEITRQRRQPQSNVGNVKVLHCRETYMSKYVQLAVKQVGQSNICLIANHDECNETKPKHPTTEM